MALKTFLVSYDLNRPNGEKAYPELIAALKRDGAVKVLYSEWLVKSDGNAAFVRDHYLAHMDDNDSIFVCDVNDWASKNIMNRAEALEILNS